MHLSMLSRRRGEVGGGGGEEGGGGGRAWGGDLTFFKNLPSNSLPTAKKSPTPGCTCQISLGWT